MIQVRYARLDWMDNEQYCQYLSLVPGKMQEEIKRYRKIDDRKARLLGKLMLIKALVDDGKLHLLNNLSIVENQKPSIKGWYEFNISHSGNFVLFCWGNIPVGIDIEKHEEDVTHEVISWLHPVELELVKKSHKNCKYFFDLWTKKEALLKNIGSGLVDNLSEINCVNAWVKYDLRDYYFYPIPLHPCYSAHICHSTESEQIVLTPFSPDGLEPCIR